jgi:xanthine dehydrogenase iron-sulfur cluster and FAD-binding subunit A
MPCSFEMGTGVSRHCVTVDVNGERRQAKVESRKLLLHFLGDYPVVTSTHVGCDTIQCGAYTGVGPRQRLGSREIQVFWRPAKWGMQL